MRLTLRTLLAYLDNTLDPQDAATLRTKIEESGFATELVARVHAVMADDSLSALPPDATGPLQDANSTSEYLDSTLSPEQVAEIERACLESNISLAEVGACHQVLTMALGQRADVPPGLKERVYKLGSSGQAAASAPGTSYSDVSIPAGAPSDGEAATAAKHPPAAATPAPVKPVGPDDSGVSDAPTRLREIDARRSGRSTSGLPTPALGGSRGRAAATDFYGGSIRPSRITPWLVSLALVAVLLFALAQVFGPLFRDDLAQQPADETSQTEPGDASEINAVPPVDPLGEEALIEDSGSEVEMQPEQPPTTAETNLAEPEENELTIAPEDEQQETEVTPEPDAAERLADAPPPPPTGESDEVATGAAEEGDQQAVVETSPDDDMQPIEGDDAAAEEGSGGNQEDGSAATEAVAETTPDSETTSAEASSASESDEPEVVEEVDADQTASRVATALSENTLLISRQEEDWKRLKQEGEVGSGATLVCPPFYRARLSTLAEIEVTLVGPTRVGLEAASAEDAKLTIASGRVVLEAGQAGASVVVQFGEQKFRCELTEQGTILGLQVEQIREPGQDPRVEENRVHLASAWTSLGAVTITPVDQSEAGTSASKSVALGQTWTKLGQAAAEVAEADSPPQWIEGPDPQTSAIDRSARDSLLQLVSGQDNIELALREAVNFRRVEVGALAARTLLLMGQSDVYFGADAVLNDQRQKNYWSEHFEALTDAINRSAEAAKSIDQAIARMAAAEHGTLFDLLTGFSQEQLENGADAELVDYLSSSSMAVRALALENLRRITGETLYFKPWETNVTRRETDAKKWQVRLRRGDIRWPEESQ